MCTSLCKRIHQSNLHREIIFMQRFEVQKKKKKKNMQKFLWFDLGNLRVHYFWTISKVNLELVTLLLIYYLNIRRTKTKGLVLLIINKQ